MISDIRTRVPRQALIGVGLGLYATAVALVASLKSKVVLSAPLIAIPLAWRILRVPNLSLVLFLLCALLAPPLAIPLANSGPHVALLFACAGLFTALILLPDWRVRPGLVHSLSGCLVVFFAAPKVSSTKPARSATFAHSFWK